MNSHSRWHQSLLVRLLRILMAGQCAILVACASVDGGEGEHAGLEGKIRSLESRITALEKRLDSAGEPTGTGALDLRILELQGTRDRLVRALTADAPQLIEAERDLAAAKALKAERRLEELRRELDEARLVYTEDHPKVKLIHRQIEDLQVQE